MHFLKDRSSSLLEHPSHFRRPEADVEPILAEMPAASTDGVIDNDDPDGASVAADAVVRAVDGVGEVSFDKDVGDDEFAVDGTEDTFDADDVAEASLDGGADDADAEGSFDSDEGVDDLVAALSTSLQERLCSCQSDFWHSTEQ